jgi:hypothetical protein
MDKQPHGFALSMKTGAFGRFATAALLKQFVADRHRSPNQRADKFVY